MMQAACNCNKLLLQILIIARITNSGPVKNISPTSITNYPTSITNYPTSITNNPTVITKSPTLPPTAITNNPTRNPTRDDDDGEYDCIASVEDCVGRDDRNYHSCTSCNVFASCWGGSTQFTDNRPCPPVHPWQEPLEYDFNLDACVWAGESTTCNGYEQEHSFFVGPSLLNWADGQTYCESQGGNLASVHSFTELVEVRDLCIGTGQTSCHIGMFMDANSGKWLWTDGSNSDYGFNSNGSPDGNIRPPWEAGYAYDGAGEKCQKMDLQLGGYFDDGYCSSNRPVICYGNAPAAKSFYNSIDFGDNFNDIDGINVKHNYYYGYIMLIGVIAFILINNIFIGCWCMGKGKKQYANVKFDMVGDDEEI